MSKGIRNYTNALFAKNNELRLNGEFDNKTFRKGILVAVATEFGIKETAAASHYNFSFKQMKAENPELVEGLGRPENKKGGRKRKEVKLAEVILAGDTQTEFEVRRKKDNVVVANGLSFEDARATVARAAKQKKAKLYWV